jgi:hypothetical protein
MLYFTFLIAALILAIFAGHAAATVHAVKKSPVKLRGHFDHARSFSA